jgi:hypothetical protein
MNEWKKDYIPFQEQAKDFDPSVSTEALAIYNSRV